MRKRNPYLIIFAAIAFLTGCATSSTVANKAATYKNFKAPYEQVKIATRHSVETLNVNISKANDFGSSYEIWFTKPVSAWSWGEQGQVIVTPYSNSACRVEVKSAKNSRLQITGTSQEEFASAIFDGIDKGLQDLAR